MILQTSTFCLALLCAAANADAERYFKITVVDAETSRGVPLVELRTVNDIRYYTDSNGVVAFYEPGLMDQTVFFHVSSHGYEPAKDGFGFAGKRLQVVPGGEAVLKIHRLNIAQRLYRVTGAGIYRDSILTGQPVPIQQPLLNGLVFGSDSVVTAVYRGRIYWFWGDTNRPSYPLGNFHVPGATSRLPNDGGLDPEAGVDLSYLADEQGFARPTAQMPGAGPTWIDGLVALKDRDGRERLFAKYVKVQAPLTVYQRGLVEFDDREQRFEERVEFDMAAPLFPGGHPFLHVDDGVEYVYFAQPYPLVRVRATPEQLEDLPAYETYSCLRQGSRKDSIELDRDPNGTLRWAWKTDTAPLTPQLQASLIKSGKIAEDERLLQLRDVETGKAVSAHSGSVYWNAFRRRWVMVAVESFGSSLLGEVWFAEADTPVGPWVYARKIVTHDKYSFYNPKQHPMFDKRGGQVIFFEGTYTNTFSGNDDRTPRYNYNQIMYQLDLSDPRLVLPVAIYRVKDGDGQVRLARQDQIQAGEEKTGIAFFALDRPVAGAVAVRQELLAGGEYTLHVEQAAAGTAEQKTSTVFYALAASAEDPGATCVPLYELMDRDDSCPRYVTKVQSAEQARPLCAVWPSPYASGGGFAKP